MAAFANIVLADGQTTPVNHTFKPIAKDSDNRAWYNDQATGVPIGYPRLTLLLRRPNLGTTPGSNSAQQVYRAILKIDVPTLEVTSPSTGTGIQPAPTVAYTQVASMEFILPARSTLADRKDILAYARNLLSNAAVVSMIQDLEAIN